MKPSTVGLALLPFIFTSGCSTALDETAPSVAPSSAAIAVAQLAGSDGSEVGTVTLVQNAASLDLEVEVNGITEGPHGFHLHTTGACTVPDFTSAGGHLNPLGKSHGSQNALGAHLGDLPNLIVNDSGKGSTSVHLEGSTNQLLEYLFDSDGTAIVIHAGPDDNFSDPAGAAGPRIACGVLTPL